MKKRELKFHEPVQICVKTRSSEKKKNSVTTPMAKYIAINPKNVKERQCLLNRYNKSPLIHSVTDSLDLPYLSLQCRVTLS